MHRFADNIYTLFASDTKQTLRARDISCRYRDVLRAQLPETMTDRAHLYFPRLFCHPAQTVRDFFLAYHMLPREAFQNDEDINRLFSSCITSALSSDPFERKEKRDKNGMVKEVYYTINPATLWEFMASAGYARDVRPDEPDKIGRYVHIDGPFADELEPQSMVQATIEHLNAYARQLNDARPGLPDEYELMVQSVLRANKEINEKTIASLPAVKMNYNEGYGRHVEHFFYENGALRITDNEITLLPYDQIDFNVERGEKLHWNITPLKDLPFEISENPEYRRRLEAIQNKEAEKDDNGKPLYTLSQLEKDRFEYAGAAGGFLDRFGYPFCRGRIFSTLEEDEGQYDRTCDIFWATGACMFVRADVYHRLGGLDADFFAHMEEIDFCRRVRNAGYKVACCPESIAYHLGGATLPKSSSRKTYLNFRNNWLMLYKNLPKRRLFPVFAIRWLGDAAASFRFLLSTGWGDFHAVYKAHRAFFRMLPENRKKRKETRHDNPLSALYPGSIVLDYFLFGRKRFSQLKKI